MIKLIYKNVIVSFMLLALFAGGALTTNAQVSAFTYQGRLTDTSMPATGSYDFKFQLLNPFGNASGAAITVEDVQVTNGIFSVQLDFGADAFITGAFTPRSVEIGVRPGASSGTFTTLAPRQPLTAAPYSVVSIRAGIASNAETLGGKTPAQYVQTDDARLSDSRNPAAGSGNYIQNNGTTTAQTGSFNISGNGRVGNDLLVVSDVTAQGVFTGNGANLTNLNAGNVIGTFAAARIPNLDAGKITTGTFADTRLSSNIPRLSAANTFDGTQTAAIFNAFQFNINGNRVLSSPGSTNLFAGLGAGASNSTGASNSFFGTSAGAVNTTGAGNVFVGRDSGVANNTGGANTFIGVSAGNENTTGSANTFIGSGAGGNGTGSNNTVIGAGAGLGADNLTNATAIGAGATATNSNEIILGRPGTLQNPGPDNVRVPGSLIVFEDIITSLGFSGQFNVCYRPNLPEGSGVIFAGCSSSIRYKKDVENFSYGLDLVRRLRPVTFTWKSNNKRDLGFVAEEVNAVEPLMTTFNDKGEVEGVKYDRISAALVNAVNEQQDEIKTQTSTNETQQAQIETQQAQIEQQQQVIKRQQKQIDALLKLTCANNQNAEVCRKDFEK